MGIATGSTKCDTSRHLNRSWLRFCAHSPHQKDFDTIRHFSRNAPILASFFPAAGSTELDTSRRLNRSWLRYCAPNPTKTLRHNSTLFARPKRSWLRFLRPRVRHHSGNGFVFAPPPNPRNPPPKSHPQSTTYPQQTSRLIPAQAKMNSRVHSSPNRSTDL